MIRNWDLAHSILDCPNSEDCGLVGNLEDFAIDFEDATMDFLAESPFVVGCRCPSCGKEFKAIIEARIDFYARPEGE